MFLEFAHSFALAFHAKGTDGVQHQRHYMLGIVAMDVNEFPYYAIEEHHEMILIDLDCRENLANLLNQVTIIRTFFCAKY